MGDAINALLMQTPNNSSDISCNLTLTTLENTVQICHHLNSEYMCLAGLDCLYSTSATAVYIVFSAGTGCNHFSDSAAVAGVTLFYMNGVAT